MQPLSVGASVFSIAVGIALLLIRRPYARSIVRSHNRMLSRWWHAGVREERASVFVIVLISVVIILAGAVSLVLPLG